MKFMLFLFCLSAIGCTNRIVNGQRHGFWKERDSIAGSEYVSKGCYRHGWPKGKWIYKKDGKRVKKEKYKGALCHVRLYRSDKSLQREGYTRVDLTDSLAHWYYTGDWFSYDSLGKITSVDTYYRGDLVGERDLTASTKPEEKQQPKEKK